MKAFVALLVVALALAVAAASPQKQYLSEVEYTDSLETNPHPSLVPHAMLEHEARFAAKKGIGKKISKAIKKGANAVGRGVKKVGTATKKVAKAAAKKAKKLAKKVSKLAKKAKNGDKNAAKKLKKAQKKLNKAAAKAGGKAARAAKRAARKAKKLARKALKKNKKAAKAAKKAAKAAAKNAVLSQDKLLHSNRKTDKRVKHATEKLHHVAKSMSSLKGLLHKIHRNVERLVPENRIRQYAMEDASKISQSRLGSLGKKDPETLTNPHSKDQSHQALYSNKVIPKRTKAIKKIDDMSVQDLAIKQKNLSKFTHKLAKKDRISLV